MKNERAKGPMQSALVLVLCGVFALTALGSTLLGSGVYRACVENGERNSTCRTVLNYLAGQVRRGDNGSLSVGSFGGSDALILSEEAAGSVYDTVVYCYGGSLYELYCERGSQLPPESGTELCALDGLDIEVRDGLVCFTADDSGRSLSISVLARAGVSSGGAYEEVR